VNVPGLAALLPRERALPRHIRRGFRQNAQARGMRVHRLASGALVAIRGPGAAGRRTAIVGTVFESAGDEVDLSKTCVCLDRGNGPACSPGLWGDYLTLAESSDGSSVRLARSAFGSLPCLWLDEGTHVLAATAPPLLEAFARERPAIDWHDLALFLLSPQMRNGATCLRGVHELAGGSVLEVGRGSAVARQRWSPWDFACPAEPLDTLAEAARVVGAAIDQAVAARCGRLAHPVLLLSGGLDSSIIAAALAKADCAFSCVNMVTRHRSGDERGYARAVAARTGSPLTECLRTLADIDWDDATPRRLVRPSARVFRQPTLRAARRVAHAVGTDTIINGGGGDDLFCSLQSVVPLLDRHAVEGLAPGTWRTARDIALRAEVDLLTVVGKAARRLASRRVAFHWPTICDFLTADARALAGEAVVHPWLDPPSGTLPGQAAHVALVLDSLSLSEDDSLDPGLQSLAPLVAQPVVEAVLRVRSWLWFAGGRNRAVIRRAFANRLPPAVIERSGKGSPVGFIAEVVEAHRLRLREMLLGGCLVAQGIVDPVEIKAVLTDTAIARDHRLGHLLVVADAERWARLWT
jgi:asparagine synthase (glutamine-hydrolysing)